MSYDHHSDDTRQNYSAPVNRERRDSARGKAKALRERLDIHLKDRFDSITLYGLADELEGLAEQFRAIGSKSIDDHKEANA